jgi:hypothetical protein
MRIFFPGYEFDPYDLGKLRCAVKDRNPEHRFEIAIFKPSGFGKAY